MSQLIGFGSWPSPLYPPRELRRGLVRTTDATAEPVTVDEAKLQARIDQNAEDELIAGLITAVRNWAEEYTERAFLAQTWQLTLDVFPPWQIYLDRPRLVAGSVAITYADTAGTTQTLAADQYRVAELREKAVLTPAYGLWWPWTRLEVQAVTVTYQAGYGTTADGVPRAIRQALLLGVAYLYRFRDNPAVDLPPAVRMLLDPYRVGCYG